MQATNARPITLASTTARGSKRARRSGWRRAFTYGAAFLVFMGLWTSISVWVLPARWYAWYGEHTFGVELMRHNLTSHGPVVDLVHRLVGIAYLLMAVVNFSPRSRRIPRLHRNVGRVMIGVGITLTVSGLVMARQSFGGWAERMGNVFFGALIVFALIRAWLLGRAGAYKPHREWMIRGFALSVGVMTLRPLYGIVTHTIPMSSADALTVCTWLGYCVNGIVAEAWVNYTRPPVAAARGNAVLAAESAGVP